ncbi:MAG: PP2C family protein-serine/threonine phosphatase [Phycisphaerales bacterium]|jgi:serine phosphatase RsbU (regulator of sigma subunit)|nr:PP2C family protein-serine/threonine phosphatase [Phycisphaerales bacterium]
MALVTKLRSFFAGTRPRRWADANHHPLILAGVFFTFFPMGLIAMMIPDRPGSWRGIITIALFCGLIAVGWASAFVLGRRWILTLVAPLQLVIPFYVFPWLGRLGWFDGTTGLRPNGTRSILMILAVASMIVGYILVVRLARRLESDGARSRAELDIASSIHKSLVPDIALDRAGVEILGTSRPSSDMGGDLIDAGVAGDRTDVILADVSGHGVGAGIVMGMLKSSARTLLRSSPSVQQLLTDLNVVLADLTKPNMFATMAVVRLHPGGAFEFGLAGHLPIFHFRAKTNDVVDLPNQSLPLGIEPDERFEVGASTLARGDTLLLITDGLMEVQDAAGREFGLASLRELFKNNATRPLAEIRDAILAAALAHGTQIDDQSLVLVRAG